MSLALLPAAVTGVLKSLLENGLIEAGVSTALGRDIVVSAQSPDRLKTGAEENPQLNIFFHHLVQKGLTRNARYATPLREHSEPGLSSVQLEMDYLISSYGTEDLHTEILLGHSVALLEMNSYMDSPMFVALLEKVTTKANKRALSPALTVLEPRAFASLVACVRVSAQQTTSQEMQNLWSTFQVAYRPSALYRVTVTVQNEADPSE
jgi:hypothetical protein